MLAMGADLTEAKRVCREDGAVFKDWCKSDAVPFGYQTVNRLMNVYKEFGGKSNPGLPLDNVGFKVLANVAQTRDEDIRQARHQRVTLSMADSKLFGAWCESEECPVGYQTVVYKEFGGKSSAALPLEKAGIMVLSKVAQTRDEDIRQARHQRVTLSMADSKLFGAWCESEECPVGLVTAQRLIGVHSEFGGKNVAVSFLANAGFMVLANVAQTRDEDIRQANFTPPIALLTVVTHSCMVYTMRYITLSKDPAMPAPRKLQPDDLPAAIRYAEKVTLSTDVPGDLAAFVEWSYTNMDTGQWRRLQTSIRQARHRAKEGVTPACNAIDGRLHLVAVKLAGLASELEKDRRRGHLSGDVAQSLRLLEVELLAMESAKT